MKKKYTVLIVAVLLIAVSVTGGVWAYLKSESAGDVANTFTVSPIKLSVSDDEDSDGKGYSNTFIKVTSSPVDVFVRAKAVFTKQDSMNKTGGRISANQPVAGVDYTIDPANFGTGNIPDWTLLSDGYYYYNQTVKSKGFTSNLVESVKTKVSGSDFGYLHMDVLAQAVQALPEAATESWGVTATVDSEGNVTWTERETK